MVRIEKKLEFVAHILIIIVALLVIGLFVQRYIGPAPQNQAIHKTPTIGKKISLNDFNWSSSKNNVLLVMQEGCPYCEASMDFYKTLIQRSQGKDVRIMAIFPPDNKGVDKYLSDRGVSGIEVKQVQFDSLEVEGTPTIIFANEQGEITNAWRGKLSASKEAEVFSLLNL